VRKREDLTHKHQLNDFLAWLLGKQSQSEISTGDTGRTFRHRVQWCWRVEPEIAITDEV